MRLQAREMGCQKPHEVQQGQVQSLAPGEEQPLAPVQAGDQPAGKQLGRTRPEGPPGGHQIEHKPAIFPCHKED